jgi:hypothetical protein
MAALRQKAVPSKRDGTARYCGFQPASTMPVTVSFLIGDHLHFQQMFQFAVTLKSLKMFAGGAEGNVRPAFHRQIEVHP